MKKVVVNASKRVPGSGVARVEAENVLSHLKEAFDGIETMSDAGYEYIPEHVANDLDVAIREIHQQLYGN